MGANCHALNDLWAIKCSRREESDTGAGDKRQAEDIIGKPLRVLQMSGQSRLARPEAGSFSIRDANHTTEPGPRKESTGVRAGRSLVVRNKNREGRGFRQAEKA